MIKAKSKQHKLIKHGSYKKYRNKTIELIRQSKKAYYQRLFEQDKKDSKTIWQGIHEIISSKKNKNGGNVSAIISDDNTITDPVEIAQDFNNFFTSIRTNLQKKIPPTKKNFTDYLKKPNSENFTIAPTTSDEISDLIHNLKSHRSVGPYSIPTKIMETSKEIMSLPLSQLINDSISKGLFPNICKLAQVMHIFKNDSRLLCTNYRPISRLSNISKIFEKVIHSRLNLSLEQNNHLYPYQFGFRIYYSTNNALTTIVERIQKQLDAGNYTAGVFVDLKKAFDTVDHNTYLTILITIVLEVLQKIGFVLT